MTKEASLYKFFSSFDLDAYEENSVPSDAKLPYITYQVITDDFHGNNVSLTASIWCNSASWIHMNKKANEISKKANAILPCDDGAIWIAKGTPFAQNLVDDEEETIKRKLLNFQVQYITNF